MVEIIVYNRVNTIARILYTRDGEHVARYQRKVIAKGFACMVRPHMPEE